MSGLAYWSHDIGGFWGEPSPALYVRWAQLGFLSALSRYHGATPREPWRFGEEALAIFREYAQLRSRLVPYLVSHGWQATETGTPLMRPMVMEFPDDAASHAFDLQYCLGRELLVSPVVTDDGWVTTYLPPGRWMDWWSGAVHRGSADAPAPGPAPRAAALPQREQPARPRTRAAARRRGPGRSPHRGGARHDGGDVRLPHGRRADRLPVPAGPGADHVSRREGSRRALILRLRDVDAPRTAAADGQALPRLGLDDLARADRGWAVDGRTAVVKARARELRIE